MIRIGPIHLCTHNISHKSIMVLKDTQHIVVNFQNRIPTSKGKKKFIRKIMSARGE